MRFLVGMSGGVDSTVAALLLREAGHEVLGATMMLWNGRYKGGDRDACFGPGEREDAAAAEKFCREHGIEYHRFDRASLYEQRVLSRWRAEFLAGRTPNPCVLCNPLMKFTIPDAARAAGVVFDAFATGHYARLDAAGPGGRMRLLRALEGARDQSYFLYRLSQEQLRGAHFPLGTMRKAQVRAFARERGLVDVAAKPDSQDFYSGDRNELVGEEDRPGDIVDESGRVVGRHTGFWKVTVGQRKGVGLSGTGDPLYVLSVDPCRNRIVVGRRAAAVARSLVADSVNWVSSPGLEPGEQFECSIKVRSNGDPVPGAIATVLPGGAFRADFPCGICGVAPGQSAVLYDGDAVLCGGFILSSSPEVGKAPEARP
ncbi:MAG: tRNA 2-thiouridine(34) synthase MnmA [Kiritimatiellae bacterium]|nr:tRNA 2-thiouridine(34) synthase MnmA [Kiritimatiellia bacterium]